MNITKKLKQGSISQAEAQYISKKSYWRHKKDSY